MKKMSKTKRILIIVLAVVVVGCAGTLYGILYNDSHFYYTENAQVMADMIAISPLVTGKLSDWSVKEGQMVKAGQVLGRQDTGTTASSSAVNGAAMGTTADVLTSKADIVCPIDGMVIETSVIQGQMVAPGTSVATVANTSNMYITANIEETNIFKIKEGQKVDVTIDAYAGKTFTGYVTSIGKATNSVFNPYSSITTSGTYSKTTQLIPVKIMLANAQGLTLYPGFNATVRVHIL